MAELPRNASVVRLVLPVRSSAGHGGSRRAVIAGNPSSEQKRRSDPVNAETFHVDQRGLDAIGRMGGHGYARTREQFDLPTMSVADWTAGRIPLRSAAGHATNLVKGDEK